MVISTAQHETREQSQHGEPDSVAPAESIRDFGSSIHVHDFDAGLGNAMSEAYSEWQRLFAADPAANIAQHPDYVLRELAAQSAPTPQHSAAEKGRIVGLGAHESWSTAAALVPKTIQLNCPLKLPLRWTLRGWRLAGNRFLGEPTEASHHRLLQAVVHELSETGADMLLIEDLEEDSDLWHVIQAQEEPAFHTVIPSPFQERLRIRFPETPEDYWTKFSSKTRNTFRRKLKKIGRTELVRITHPSQIADFLEHAHRISLNSWQTQRLGLRVRNNDSELELLTFLALNEAFRSYLLYQGDRAIAFLIGTQFKGYFNYEEVAYDSEFANQSPGQVLLLKVLEDLIGHETPAWFDFGGGDADYKRLFATECSRSGNVWLMPPTFRTMETIALLKTRRMIGKTARLILKSTGLMRRVRQRTRMGKAAKKD